MNVLYLATECKPFSQVGGVGDVAGALPPAIKKLGVEIEIVTPLYGLIEPRHYQAVPAMAFRLPFNGVDESVRVHKGELDGVPVHFIANTTYFEGHYNQPYIDSPKTPFYDDALRFSFFSRACFELIEHKAPDIVHINDWGLGYLFGWMALHGLLAKRILTIHNIGYQGNIGIKAVRGWQIAELLADKRIGPLFRDPRPAWKSLNPLRLALELCDQANTVSPNYCREITQSADPARYFEGGAGLEATTRRLVQEGRLFGILNGIHYDFAPDESQFKRILAEKASMKARLGSQFPDPDAFLVGFVGRAVEQKFKLLTEELDGASILEHILALPGVNVAILATGLHKYERFLQRIGRAYANCAVTIGFDPAIATQINLGSDLFLMPSLFEPCGIAQMQALRVATPPLVRATGGLVDTVRPHDQPGGTGFIFDGEDRESLLRNLLAAVEAARQLYRQCPDEYRRLGQRGFQQRFTWESAATQYIEKLYH